MESARTIIKKLFYGFFKTIGSYRYYRHKNRHKPIVLTYHGVVPKISPAKLDYEYRNFVTVAQFEKQIQFLLRKYRPMKVNDFLETSMPERSFLITFDDGFRNNLKYAVPILKKYGLQGGFFITTGLIGTKQLLWTEQVTYLLQRTRKKKLEIHCKDRLEFDLHTIDDRERASIEIRKRMKDGPAAKIFDILSQIQSELSDVSLEIRPEEEGRYLFMDWDDVREMISADQIIGSHTHMHPILSKISEEESYEELKISKDLIEKETDTPCQVFSYPNGEAENFTEIHKGQLAQLGYRCAFSQISPFKEFPTDLFALPRTNITLKMPMSVFEAKLSGFKGS